MKHENNEKYFQTQSALTDRNEQGGTGHGDGDGDGKRIAGLFVWLGTLNQTRYPTACII